jgi:hypothetical protein
MTGLWLRNQNSPMTTAATNPKDNKAASMSMRILSSIVVSFPGEALVASGEKPNARTLLEGFTSPKQKRFCSAATDGVLGATTLQKHRGCHILSADERNGLAVLC